MTEDIEKFLAATAFLIAAAVTTFDTIDFLQASVIVPGQVTRLPYGTNHPRITFVTKTGTRVSYTLNGFGFNMGPGDDVQVRYLPEDPRSSARLNRLGAIWESSIGWGILGVGFALGGIGCLLTLRHNQSKAGD